MEGIKKWLFSHTFIRRLDLLILYGLFVFIGILAFNAVQNANERALKIAVGAAHDANEDDAFIEKLKRQKVCSSASQGQACVDLFERLSENITDAQRKQLACTVLKFSEFDEQYRKIGCKD